MLTATKKYTDCMKKFFMRVHQKNPVQLASWCDHCEAWYQPFDHVSVGLSDPAGSPVSALLGQVRKEAKDLTLCMDDPGDLCLTCVRDNLVKMVKASIRGHPKKHQLTGMRVYEETRRKIL